MTILLFKFLPHILIRPKAQGKVILRGAHHVVSHTFIGFQTFLHVKHIADTLTSMPTSLPVTQFLVISIRKLHATLGEAVIPPFVRFAYTVTVSALVTGFTPTVTFYTFILKTFTVGTTFHFVSKFILSDSISVVSAQKSPSSRLSVSVSSSRV
jgi:hypothetical protein